MFSRFETKILYIVDIYESCITNSIVFIYIYINCCVGILLELIYKVISQRASDIGTTLNCS